MASGRASASCELVSSSNVCSTSRLSNISFTYEWRVEKFIDVINRQYEIHSQGFFPGPPTTDQSSWKLVLFTKHDYPDGPHLAASLVKLSKDGRPHSVKYTISLVTESNNYPDCIQMSEKIFRHALDYDNCVIASHAELVRKKIIQRPQRPNLTIRCEMDILVTDNAMESTTETAPPAKRRGSFRNNLSLPSSSMDYDVGMMEYADKESNLCHSPKSFSDDDESVLSSTMSQNNESLSALSSDFGSLYLMKKLTDVHVVAEGKSISAHKAVLAARSDFFSSCGTGNQICVTGIRSAVMEAVLFYLYTGKTRPLTVDLALDLMRAAKRFRLELLQKLTWDFLRHKIQLDNVLDVFEVVDELGLDDLKHVCLKFMSHNRYELELTEKWQVVLKKNPRIAGQVLLAIASVQTPNIL